MKKIILLLLTNILILSSVKSQKTYVPDDGFEQLLIYAGWDSGPLDDSVLTINISSVTSLTFPFYYVSDLTGIEDFTSLTYLDCRYNLITNLDLSSNSALTYLNCAGNIVLTHLNISSNHSLTFLNLDLCPVTYIDVSNCDSLITLYTGSKVSALDVSKNSVLKHIYLSKSTELTWLDLSNNHLLEDIRVMDCVKLKELNLANGNNLNAHTVYIFNSPLLNCIQVDDTTYSDTTWLSPHLYHTYYRVDTTFNYGLDCGYTPKVFLDTSFCGSIVSPSGVVLSTDTAYYVDVLKDTSGVDSIIYYINYKNKNTFSTLNISTCFSYLSPSGSYTWTSSGIYYDTLINSYGCDSILTVNLNIGSVSGTKDTSACYSYSSPSGLYTWTTSGTYIDTLTISGGCDSIITVNLTIHNTSFANEKYDICFGDTVSILGNLYTSTITFSDTLVGGSQYGCDSITIFSIASTSAPCVYIPDARFKAVLLSDHTINTNRSTPRENSVIDINEARAYSGSIICPSNNITSLVGIEAFINIDSLLVENNRVSKVDLSKNTKLEVIDFDDNILDSLDLTQNVDLMYLECSDNRLDFIDISQNKKLLNLDCSLNQLTVLDVSNNVKLVNLNCGYNNLIHLGLRSNSKLEILYCEFNQLNGVYDFSTNTSLQALYCYDNNISAIDVSKTNNFRFLHCSDNNLTVLNLANGSNTSLGIVNAETNPNLTCVQVDNVSYSQSNWNYPAHIFDSQVVFNTFCVGVGVNENIKISSVNIYPNPTTGVLNIEFEKSGNYSLFSIDGKQVLQSGILQSEKTNIDISSLKAGMYLLRVVTDEGNVINKRVVKQ